MKLRITRVFEGDSITKYLGLCGCVGVLAPEDGLLIQEEGRSKVYVRASDLEAALKLDASDVVEVDPWRKDDEASAEQIPTEE